MDINLGLSAVATGVDTITATYSPAPTLVDKKVLFLRTAGINTTTTPTFNPNGLGAKTIVKNGGDALVVGELDGVVILMYDLANTRWELITPAMASSLKDAIYGANAPSGANVFATINDFAPYATLNFPTFTGDITTPAIIVSDETVNTIASFDANKNIKSLALATYPSLTELTYVKGVTSAIQTQLNAKLDTFNLDFSSGSTSPSDSVTLYFGGTGGVINAASSTATNNSFTTPNFAFTIISVIITVGTNTVAGTTEDSTLQFRNITDATSSSIGTFKTNGTTTAQTKVTYDGLNIAVPASKEVCLQWDTPAWVTNPTLCRVGVILICRKS